MFGEVFVSTEMCLFLHLMLFDLNQSLGAFFIKLTIDYNFHCIFFYIVDCCSDITCIVTTVIDLYVLDSQTPRKSGRLIYAELCIVRQVSIWCYLLCLGFIFADLVFPSPDNLKEFIGMLCNSITCYVECVLLYIKWNNYCLSLFTQTCVNTMRRSFYHTYGKVTSASHCKSVKIYWGVTKFRKII